MALRFLSSIIFGYTSVCDVAFERFVADYGKVYASPAEASMRKRVFCQNLEEIYSANESYELGLNEYADLTDAEFAAQAHPFVMGRPNGYDMLAHPLDLSGEVKASIDWSGSMSGIQNQGACGSCYAFSALETVQAHWHIKHGEHLRLSIGEIIDCSGEFGNFRCDGGYPIAVLAYVKHYGVCPADKYAYEIPEAYCHRGGACYQAERTYITAFHTVDALADEDNLVRALQTGPVSIAIAANTALRFYRSGVFTGCDLTTPLNHAVVAVGYDETSFLVQNSWGSSWGSGGLFRLPRNAESVMGACGLRATPVTVSV